MNPHDENQAAQPSGSKDSGTFAAPDKLQKLENRVLALQAQAELFQSIPFLPQRLRGFFAQLVGLLADMAAAIDAIQATQEGRRQ